MEGRLTLRTLNNNGVGKVAYILRTDIKSEKFDKEYKHAYRTDEDLVTSNVLLPKGMDKKYMDAEKLLNDYQQSQYCRRYDSRIGRDCEFNLANDFVVMKNGIIDKEKTTERVKPIVEEFLNKHFVDNGNFSTIYAVHFSTEKENQNLHVHFITLGNAYSTEEQSYLPKTYLDNGKRIYRDPLDDKTQSKEKILLMRKDLADIQNRELKKIGSHEHVEYQSYANRNINKVARQHLRKKEYEQLQALRKDYSHIEDISKRNEAIKSNHRLTHSQIKDLDFETYNALNEQKQAYINSTVLNAYENKKTKNVHDYTKLVGFKPISIVVNKTSQALKSTAEELSKEQNQQKKGRRL